MKTFFALSNLVLLLLFAASSVDARNGLGEFWKAVMKDQPMPESIQVLIDPVDPAMPSENLNHKEEKPSVKEFKPTDNNPFFSHYRTKLIKEKIIVENFEPGGNIPFLYYSDKKPADEKYSSAQNIESRDNNPSFSSYHTKPTNEKSVVEKFELRVNIPFLYYSKAVDKKYSFVKNSKLGDKPTKEKPAIENFEPRSNISFLNYSDRKPTDEKYSFSLYHTKTTKEKPVVQNFESKLDSSK